MHSGPRVGALTWVELGVLSAGLGVALAVRALLLPLPGLAGDLELFTGWARAIAVTGLGRAYEQPLSFPPVLPWIWAGLGALDPRLATAGPDDLGVRVLMKIPATLADLGLAAVVGWWFRGRSSLAIGASLAVLLAPAVVYISAWWGQFESIYVLPALLAVVLAIRRRKDAAAILAAVALMTKPQALPLVVPLAAWFLATTGWRGTVRAVVVGCLTIGVLWLPFLPSGGIGAYVDHLGLYANQTYDVISLRAWNPWWLAQLATGEADFVSDGVPLLGPITLRWLGAAVASILLLLMALRLYRRPVPEALAWATAAAALGTFVTLTTMHERYAYPALVFLVLLWPNRLALATWLALLAAMTANVVAAVPPTGGPGSLIPLDGTIGALGAGVITACAVACLAGLWRATRRDTSGDSAAATAAA